MQENDPSLSCRPSVEKSSKTFKSINMKCSFCELYFGTNKMLLLHIEKIHRKRQKKHFMCSACGKQFRAKNELTLHIKSKCGTLKQFKCEVCFQELMSAGSLYNHMLRHNGDRSFMCRFCAKLFYTAGQLKVHERIHTQDRAYICEVCHKGFCHRQSLITHSTLHTGVKPFQCENCGNSFSCVGNLMKHRKTHADTCGLLPLTTHRVENPSTKLRIKINTPATARLKNPPVEEEISTLKAALLESIKTEKNGSCDNMKEADEVKSVCGSLYRADSESHDTPEPVNILGNAITSEKEFSLDHQQQSARNVSIDVTVEHITQGIFKLADNASSSKCDLNVESKSSINMCPDTPLQPHGIDSCKLNDESQFNDRTCRDIPIQSHYADSSKFLVKETKTGNARKCSKQDPSLDKEFSTYFADCNDENNVSSFMCRICKKLYRNVTCMYKHLKEHKEVKERDGIDTHNSLLLLYKCSCCKLSFQTKEDCLTHQQAIHADILTCYDCDKLFANRDSLRSHQKVFHKGIAKKMYSYICDKCGKQFAHKSLMVSHCDQNCEGPFYECPVCKKKFSNKHTLKKHMTIHDPEKKLVCKFCAKGFRWKGQLKIHERSHTGEKPFACLYCPKAFAYRESLITHSTIHTGVKPHLCDGCGSRFSCIGNLIKHRSAHAECGKLSYKPLDQIIKDGKS